MTKNEKCRHQLCGAETELKRTDFREQLPEKLKLLFSLSRWPVSKLQMAGGGEGSFHLTGKSHLLHKVQILMSLMG